MKTFFCLMFLFFFAAAPVSAHDLQQPHFLKVNGTFIDHYPIRTTSLPDFILPREIDTRPHLINQPITFSIDKNNIPLNHKNLNDSAFTLDFGDGTSEKGVFFTHQYTQPGTNLLAIRVNSVLVEKETTITTAFIHIVPETNYQLPKAVITVNDGLWSSETNQIDLSKKINLSANLSSPQLKITHFIWDLGDGSSSTQMEVEHLYASQHFGSSVLLRIKDDQGLIADTQIRLSDKQKDGSINEFKAETPSGFFSVYSVLIGIFVLIVFIAGLFYYGYRK